MYALFETIVGIPLTQRHYLPDEDFLHELAPLVIDGFDIQTLPNCPTERLSANAWGFVHWMYEQRSSFQALKVALHTSHNGDGEAPVWLGVHVDMPGHDAFEAQRIRAHLANAADVQKLKQLQALFFLAPEPYREVLLRNLDFWSLHATH